MIKLFGVALVILMLSGCIADQHEAQNNQGPSITAPTIPVLEDLKKRIEENYAKGQDTLHREIGESTNAIQANVNSMLGASVGKIGERVTGLEANLQAKVTGLESNINSKIDKLENNLNIALSVNNELKAKLESVIKMNAELSAKLEAKVDGLVGAQAGLHNEMTKMSSDFRQDLRAGRDVVNQQFTDQVLAAVQSANKTTVDTNFFYSIILLSIVICACIVLIKMMHTRVQKAEERVDSSHRAMVRAVTFDPSKARAFENPGPQE